MYPKGGHYTARPLPSNRIACTLLVSEEPVWRFDFWERGWYVWRTVGGTRWSFFQALREIAYSSAVRGASNELVEIETSLFRIPLNGFQVLLS